MKSELLRSENETCQLLEAAELLEKEALLHSEDKDKMGSSFEKKYTQLTSENRRLRVENEQLNLRGKYFIIT